MYRISMLTFCLQDNNKTEQTGVTILEKKTKQKEMALKFSVLLEA